MAVDATYSTSNYEKQGGATWEVGGALNVLSGGTFAVESGGTATTDAIAETTAAAGVTVDGMLIKDGGPTVVATAGVLSSVAGMRGVFVPMLVQQALSGAGAVNLTTFYTAVTNTGSDALTLADSTVLGQLKKVKMIVDPGTDSTLTFNTNATIVFADVGDYALLMWNGSDWIPIELGNDADGATAPAYTPAS